MNELEQLLPETDGFPVGEGINVLRGKTLTKTPTWWKAMLLTDVGQKKQIRLYGWQKNKEGEWKLRQKFNISKSYAHDMVAVFSAFGSME